MMKHRKENGPTSRQLKVGELIKRNLAELFVGGRFYDPVISEKPVTITEVRVSPDLKNATIFLLPLNSINKDEFMEAIKKVSGKIRSDVTKKINLKYSPELFFKFDDTFDKFSHMEAIFNANKEPNNQ